MRALATSPLTRHPGSTALAIAEEWARLASTALYPPVLLLLRWLLAAPFLMSGLLKISDWNTALLLAEHEYPVAWMAPEVAAWTGVSVELAGAALLFVGLGTRFAAIALMALTIVVHVEYKPLAEHLLVVAGCLWLFVRGAGALSLDHLVARGFADTALPLGALVRGLFAWITRVLGPLAVLALRSWLALLMVLWGLALGGQPELLPMARSTWSIPVLPVSGAAPLMGTTIAVLGVCLLVGLATRVASIALLLTVMLLAFAHFHAHREAMLVVAQLLLLGVAANNTWSLDHLISTTAHRRFPLVSDLHEDERATLPHVVIVGAGFGGLSCARALRHDYCRVTLIDRHNYHLFAPLLYQVATATLSPADIATPIRGMVRPWANARVILGEVTAVDAEAGTVAIADGAAAPRHLEYDYLVLATGARHSYFGRDEWAPYAPGLKRIEDATTVRGRLLLAFEHAENTHDDTRLAALLTFVIVGAGPTGVELAGAIAELARHGMDDEFEHIDPRDARVILVQSGPRVLPAFPEALSARTQRDLERLGVEVRTNSRVLDVDGDGVLIGEERIAARTVFWAAGVASSPAAQWLGVEADRAGRTRTAADLGVPGFPGVYVIGDAASVDAWDGQPVPGLAPAAKQAGIFVAGRIRDALEGKSRATAFRYRHLGSMATIGRKAAVADFGALRLSGTLAWWLWGAIHVAFLANMRSRISVSMDWFWAYLTFRASTRLITGTDDTTSAKVTD